MRKVNLFKEAVVNHNVRTDNGMKARRNTSDACTDLFFKIGASRGRNIITDFKTALSEDREIALRIAAWSRDIRGGAGERQIFRDILNYLEVSDVKAAKALALKVGELGRWDDLFVFKTDEMRQFAFGLVKSALIDGNSLAAKWTPRKGEIANAFRQYLGMSPRMYRKALVALTDVVETKMCAKEWESINFSHVPSVASARYKRAFSRNSKNYIEYVAKLTRGDGDVKVNASAIFPHDVLKGVVGKHISTNRTHLDLIKAQWDALPNYVGGANILPLVDVSGSMTCPAGGISTVTCLDIAVSLGLYLADKNTGNFGDCFMTFSESPSIQYLSGDILQKVEKMCRAHWDMNTNLHRAFNEILEIAVRNEVPQKDMPEMIIIFSDMQFDGCVQFDDSAIEMIRRKYEKAGYNVPKVVFWNLNARDNAPVKFNEQGVALVSGFSPAILTSILSCDFDAFSPYGIMMKTVMQDRYKVF